jgi:hypothetical protein
MRHLVGVMLAIVMAAAIFFAASWGYLKLLIGPAGLGRLPGGGGSLLHNHAVLEGFGALLGVGLLAGLLMAVPRYLSSVRHAVQYIPLKTRPYGMGFEALLFDGMLALAGLAMVVPLFVPSRWRGRREVSEPEPYAGTTASFPDLQATQTMHTDSGLLSDWTQTKPQPQQQAEPGNPSPPSSSQAPWGPADYT